MNTNEYENAETVSMDTLALEEMVKEERTKEIARLDLLSKKVSNLHTNVLYYRKSKSKLGTACYEAWKVLLKRVGGTPNGWRDLGYALGIGQDDLDYIMASVKDDPVDMVLKVYRQNENATIDKIIDALIKRKRYDIVRALEEPLCQIAKLFNKDDTDDGYHSNEKSTGQRKIITLNLPNDIPPALNKNMVLSQKEPDKPKQPLPKPSTTTHKTKVKNDEPILFLTFAQDGLPTAINIQEYVANWYNFPSVQVITLSEKKDEIYQNPEKFIRHYFEKADFIVPIITPGYFEQIQSHNINVPNTSENLDHKYANFIYNLIVNHYIHATGCLNMKVRSVLPQNSKPDLFRRIILYPDLQPWTYEKNFDEQFQEFLRKE